jgi:hypothetical protein
MKLLGQTFARTGVAQPGKMFHVLHPVRQLAQEGPGHILGTDRVLRESGTTIMDELLPDLSRQVAGGRELLRLRIGAKRLFGVLAKFAVDFSGREVGAIEQNLDANSRRRHTVGCGRFVGKFSRIDALGF